MSSVYLAIPGAPDRLLGHVDDAGRVSRSQAGFDDEIGHVDAFRSHTHTAAAMLLLVLPVLVPDSGGASSTGSEWPSTNGGNE